MVSGPIYFDKAGSEVKTRPSKQAGCSRLTSVGQWAAPPTYWLHPQGWGETGTRGLFFNLKYATGTFVA